jgi:predicted metal-dependent peptidase
MPLVQTDLKSPVAGVAGRWPKLKLESKHIRPWDENRAAMLWAVPLFADIWLGMMVDKDGEQAWFTDQIPTAATDDKFLYVNPTWYFGLTLDERLFVDCHEIAHAMFGHAGLFYLLGKQGHIDYSDGVRLPFDFEMMNCAADYVINDQLINAKIGKMPDGGLHWPDLINGDMGVADAYRALYKVSPKRKGGDKGDPGEPTQRTTGGGRGKSFDKVLKPGEGCGKSPNKAMGERSQSDWDLAIQAATDSARMRGHLPANLARLLGSRLKPQADWRDLYQLAVSRKIGNDRYTWDVLDQQFAYRGIGVPGRTAFGCDLVVIAVDTSGSISQRTLDVFIAETMGLMEQVRPKMIMFTQCDASIHEWREVVGSDDLYGAKLKGGGGTAFEPVFERIEAEGLRPDMLVYLTDLDGSFPFIKPSYPVVWGCITKDKSAPFGEIVYVPPQADSGE